MLTRKQRDLLEFIHARMSKDGVPPSFDEMKDALDLRSKSGIHRLITALEERGFIRRLAHRARAIEIVRMPDETVVPMPKRTAPRSGFQVAEAVELPVMGRIAAGVPIEAISEVSTHLPVPGSMVVGNADHFALEVQGESMIEAGINDGDVVVIREQSDARDGDIVVALVEGHEATLKTFRRRRGEIVLEAANPAFEDRAFRDDQVAVQGRLVGLIRTY